MQIFLDSSSYVWPILHWTSNWNRNLEKLFRNGPDAILKWLFWYNCLCEITVSNFLPAYSLLFNIKLFFISILKFLVITMKLDSNEQHDFRNLDAYVHLVHTKLSFLLIFWVYNRNYEVRFGTSTWFPESRRWSLKEVDPWIGPVESFEVFWLKAYISSILSMMRLWGVNTVSLIQEKSIWELLPQIEVLLSERM